MPSIPALDDRVELPGVPRGEHFIELLASIGVQVEGRHLADLGSGFGSIAIAAAQAGAASVAALDASADRLQELDRARKKRALSSIRDRPTSSSQSRRGRGRTSPS